MNRKLKSKIAELIGAHVGDGTLYKTSRGTVWELRGGLNEKDYYWHNIVPLLKSIFDVDFIPKFRSGGKNGCFGIQTTNKDLIALFLHYGFKPGTKTYTVRVPDYISKSSRNIQNSFIRGLFDTDGYLRFERINNDKYYRYPKIEFGTASINLRDDLQVLLRSLGYRTYIWGKQDYRLYKLCLAGISNLNRFMKEVSPKNKKHLNKYQFWKDNGHHITNAAVA
jgi:hypothetical protein